MEKVGILSMQRVHNYGSFLQAYALMCLLKKEGRTIEFVDYNDYSLSNYSLFKSKIKYGLLHIVAIILRKFRFNNHSRINLFCNSIECEYLYKVKFYKYYDKLRLTKKSNTNPNIDTLVIGSDEVFNIQHGTMALFGENTKAKNIYSFAASFGNTNFQEIQQKGLSDRIANCLLKFNKISVRDTNSLNIVKELTSDSIPIFKSLDPVFHYSYAKELRRFHIKKKYILIYSYSGLDNETKEAITEYAMNKRLEIICVQGYQQNLGIFVSSDPFEILSLFINASFIITTTFHGCVLGAKYKKNMAVHIVKNTNNYSNENKLGDLINCLQLQSRVYEAPSEIKTILDSNFDYTQTEKIIKTEVENGLKYLQSI